MKRTVATIRMILVVIGAIMASISVAGMVAIVALDTLGTFMLLALGIALILTGVFKVNLVELVV
jgi:hypothetical protein